MFSFFKKKEEIKITDVIFIKSMTKWTACLEAIATNPSVVFVAWFEETVDQLEDFIKQQNAARATVMLYREATTHSINGKQVIFVEHYPLHEKEEALYLSLELQDIKVFSSLDEPLFLQFGGNRMAEMFENMGVQDNEHVQHSMITKALKNAQQKIREKVLIEQSAPSQAEWFNRNLNKTI